jgi:hypothetical protein
MIIDTPSGTRWHVENASKKLCLRARLPGARVFDLATSSLRLAKQGGMSHADRIVLALPASWLVNSPAISRVLRRWVLPPDREVWVALLDLLENGDVAFLEQALAEMVAKLGTEPYAIEAISKVLALLVPEVVPLMPPPARAFVLGADVSSDAAAFVAMVRWFVAATRAHAAELAAIAGGHAEVPLVGAQVLDRLLWFDSAGRQFFESEGLL